MLFQDSRNYHIVRAIGPDNKHKTLPNGQIYRHKDIWKDEDTVKFNMPSFGCTQTEPEIPGCFKYKTHESA